MTLIPSFTDAIGWIATGSMGLALLMATMERLRLVATGTNAAFMVYAVWVGDMAFLALQLVLFAINAVRYVQMQRRIRAVRRIEAPALDLSWLPEDTPQRRLAAGETLFCAGEAADALYVVLSGRLAVAEAGATLGPGAIVGEIALFAPQARRTATVSAATDVTLARLTEGQVRKIHYDNPDFAWGLVRLITRRMLERHEPGAALAPADRPRPGAT